MIHCSTAQARTARAGRAGLLIASILASTVAGSCVPDADLSSDGVLTAECGQRERIDAQVKQQAAADFAAAGKPCQPYDMHLTTTNPQETLWRVCCSGFSFNYIYFPQKCVVRKASGPNECK